MLIWLRSSKFVDANLTGVGIDGNVLRREDCAQLISLDEGFAMLDTTRRVLDEERAAAQQQMQEEAQQIYARALKEGEEQGRQLALQEWYERTIGTLADYRAIQKRMRERLAELIASAVEQIVQVEDSQGLFLRALSSLDQIVEGASFLTVSVNRNDFAKAQQVFDEFANEWSRRGQPIKIIVHADKDLPAGSCICESEFGIVDASLHTQVQAMRAALERALAKEMSEETTDREQNTFSASDELERDDEPLAQELALNHESGEDMPSFEEQQKNSELEQENLPEENITVQALEETEQLIPPASEITLDETVRDDLTTLEKPATATKAKTKKAAKPKSTAKTTTKAKSSNAKVKSTLDAEEKPKAKRKTKSAPKANEVDAKEDA